MRKFLTYAQSDSGRIFVWRSVLVAELVVLTAIYTVAFGAL